MKISPAVLLVVALPFLTATYYYISFGAEVDKVFLSISTFLFSILTGFFISRQASRFNKVRETVTQFDGLTSAVFRSGGHINKKFQTAAGKVITAHYQRILETGQWNVHFKEKSTTLTELHKLLEKHIDEDKVTKLANQAIGAVTKSLVSMQGVRKQMLALDEERIPKEQWFLIAFFALILTGTVSTMASVGELFPSILKAAFVISIVSVLIILYRLNNLMFTEKLMGQHSAEDVLGIIEGSK